MTLLPGPTTTNETQIEKVGGERDHFKKKAALSVLHVTGGITVRLAP